MSEDAIIQEFPIEKMEALCLKHKKLEEKFYKYQARVQMKNAPPLDYILNLPEELID